MMQPTRPRRPRFRAALASLVFAFALTTCDHPAAGPGGRAALAVQVVIPESPDLALFNLTIDNVRLIVVRPPSDTVFNQVFFFPPDQTDLPLEADIPMQTSPETFRVTIELLSGTQVLFSGTQDVSLDEGTTNPPAQLPVTYSGPGQNVATLSIGPVDSVLTQGGTLQFRLTAQDAQGAPVSTFYASWTTSDTTVARVDATGLLTAPFSRTTVNVQARTPGNVSVSTPITFVPAPIAINIVSGCGQSGSPGAQLPQPIVARVVAGDGLGVEGVQVQFTAPTGGSVATPLVVTDDNGLAQTLATLPPQGPAGFSIGATGLAPVSCNQTVFGATHLAFTAQPPASLVAGSGFFVVVTALDAQGNTATGFTGAVSLAFGTHPVGATLSGTTLVTAVAGVATFTSVGGFTVAGVYTLVASSGSLTPATSTPFDVVPGAPAQLAFAVPPSGFTVTQGVPINPAPQVVIRDAFGNSATTATDNVTIDIGANPGGSVLGGTATQAAIAGVATFPGLTLNEVGTGYTLIATSGILTPATSAPFNVVAVTGLHLVFTTQPSNVTAGSVMAPAVVVTAQDAQNNPVPSFTGDVTIGFGSCAVGAILSGTTAVAAVSGSATFADLSIDRAGGCIFVASSSGLQSVVSANFTVTAGAAAQLAFTVQPSNVLVGAFISPIVRVEIQDALGNTVPTATDNVTLAIGANPGNAVLGGTLTKAAVSGVVLFTDLTLSQAGTAYTLVATSGTLTSATSTTFDVTAGAVTQLAVVVTPPSVTAGTPATIVVTAQDGSGATVTGYIGTVHITSTDQQATLPLDYTFTTGDNGVHTFTGGATLRTQGNQSVTATDVVTSSITGSGSVSVTAGAAAVLVFTVQPTDVTAGASINPAVLVTARDASGNTATSFAGTVSLAIGTNPGGAVLLFTTSVSAAAGVASFDNVSLDKVGTGYTLVATSASLTSGPSAPFTVNVGSAIQLAFVVQPSTVTQGSAIAPAVAVALQDQFGNLVPTRTDAVTMSIGSNPGSASLGGTLIQLASAGIATFGDLTLSAPGSGYTLMAVAAGFASIESAPFGVLAGAAGIAWNNPAGGNWSVPGNWLPARVPGKTDTVFINLPGTYTVTLDVNDTVAFLTMGGGGSPTLAGSSRTFGVDSLATIGAGAELSLTNGALNGAGVTNQGTLRLQNTTVNAGVQNAGLVIARSSTAFNGTLANALAATLRVEGDAFCCSTTTTVLNGFTNNGTIELTAINATGTTAQLNVTNGTLINAGGATPGAINVLAGNGGARTLNAALNNQGTLTVNQPLTINRASSVHSNSGTITLAGGDLTINQSGTTPSFTNTGTIAAGAGDTLTVNGGAFTHSAGSLGGLGALVLGSVNSAAFAIGHTLSAITLNSTTASFSTSQSTGATAFTLSNSTVNGPGTFTNLSGQTLVMTNGVMNAALDNQGLLLLRGSPEINGTFTTTAGSTLRVEGDAFCCSATATVLNGFANNGTIILTAINATGTTAQLTVTNGTLVNASGRLIDIQAGNGGARTLNAALNNQGTLLINQPLTMGRASSVHSNSGTINVTGGDFTVNQSGTTPSFTNSGTINVPNGRTWTVSGGAWTHGGTTLGGATQATGGALVLGSVNPAAFNTTHTLSSITLNSTVASFALDQTTATAFTLNNATVNGPGKFTNLQSNTLVMTNGVMNADLANQGLLVLRGSPDLNGVFTTTSTSTLRVEGDAFCCSATATVLNGFTNNGTIILTAINATGTTAQFTVTNGTLVNATGRLIDIQAGNGGARTLNAALNNQGTLSINHPLTMGRASSVHSNSGTINVFGGDFTVNQSGTTPGFTNSGTINVPTGRTWTISGGAWTHGGPTLGGATQATGGALVLGSVNPAAFNTTHTLSSITLNSTVASFALDQTTATAFTLNNATVNGPGKFTNLQSNTLVMTNGVMNADLANQGLLVLRGSPDLNGVFTTTSTSTLRVEGDAFCCSATATVLNGFANNGTIELIAINATGTTAQLSVTNGTLVNVGTAAINVLTGAGGARTLNAALNNQGTFTINQPLTMGRPSSVHQNSGTINIASGDLTINQSGTTPSFTNTGTINLPSGRTWTVSGGAWTHSGPTLGSGGALVLSSVNPAAFGTAHTLGTITLNSTVASFAQNQSSASTAFTFTNATVNGPGGFTNAAGKTIVMTNGVMNAAFDNQGLFTLRGSPDVNGTFTTGAGSTLRVEGDAFCCSASATILDGFTNNGTIQLTAINATGTTASLSVTNGILVSASGRLIDVQAGNGGARALNAALDNKGTITVSQGLTVNKPDADHANSGLLQLVGGDMTVTESGTRPGFSNTGTIDVGTNKLVVNGTGAFLNQSGGIMRGSGTFDIGPSISFITNGITTVGGVSPGTLNFVGPYLQGPTPSVMNVRIGGNPANPGVDYDQLKITNGGATLQGGILNVTMGTIQPGSYVIIQLPVGQTFTGNFGQINFSANCDLSPTGPVGNQYLLTCQ